MSKRVFVCLSIFLLATASAYAQAVAGMGGITGSVRDASGAVVSGATVVVANESRGIRRNLATTEAGVFSAPSLLPSSGYIVTVSMQGFANWEAKNIEILVGQTLDIKATLQVASAATQVDIVAEIPLVEEAKSGVSQVVEKDQIDNLPINGRRADSFVLLTPAVTNDGEFGLVSFRGVAGGNSFLTDGNDTTGSFYNENAGRTRIATQISQDAVQEFQVLSNGFSAEFGRAMGGVINTVTRSGTNQTHGTLFWFFRNRTLNATDRYANGLNAPEWRHQAGGSLGGTLKKDKIFYFANMEIVRRNFPAQNRIINSQFTDASGNVINAPCGPTVGPGPSIAQCDAARAFIYRQMNVLVPRSVESLMGFAKIDWRPTDRNSFSFSANAMHWRSPHGIQTQAVLTNGNAIANNADSTVETRYGKAAWTAIPNNATVNEFRFGWFKDRLADPSAQDLFPKETGPLGITLNGTTIGAAGAYPRVLPSENRFQFVDNLSWTKGAHSVKFGIDFATTEDYNNQLFNRFGSYSYQSLANFAMDFSGNTGSRKSYSSFTQQFGNPILVMRTNDINFYAQDVWKVTRKLTFNYGMRFEHTWLPQPTVVNPDYPQTGKIHAPPLNVSPRASLSYSINDKTVIRAGYGVFFARFHGASIQNLLLVGNGRYQANYSLNPNTDTAAPVFPNILSSAAGSAGTISLAFAGPDFRSPYTQQGTFAIERQIGRDTGLTLNYIWSHGVALFTNRDLNLGPASDTRTYTILDSAGAQTGSFTTPVYLFANRVDRRYRSIYMTDNGGKSFYNGLAVQVRRRMGRNFSGNFSYTWSHAIDTANQGGASDSLFVSNVRSTYNGDYNNDKGSSLLDQRHRVVINFLWTPKFTNSTSVAARYLINGWQLSVITTMASAKPTPSTINVTSALPGLANNTTLNGSFGSNRVPFWRFNALDIDQIFRVDSRIQRQLPISERVKAVLSFEAFNTFNTIYNTGVIQQAYQSAAGVLRPTANMGVGTQSQGFPDGTNARRMQAGLRFIF
ncbi:MAG: TonB-dependent receptor [Acidobacteria bacterium]|nr:TonB-dependent receptor [Acidobacteriota bacterium]